MNNYKVNIIFGNENINKIIKRVLIKEIRKTFKISNKELTSNSTCFSLKEEGKNC